MKSSKLQTLLFSAAGVLFVFIALVGLNLIFSPARLRLDLTGDKLHTLSPGTREILRRLDGPVEVRFYVSQGKDRMPQALKTYVQSVDDLLAEFRAESGNKIEIRKIDPEPDSEAEDSARLDGVQGQPLPNGEEFYLGIAVENPPDKAVLPFLAPQREKLLEYDLARAVSQVLSTNRPVVGVMSPLPVMGGAMNPMMMMQMGRQQQSEPWVFVSELRRDFDVRSVPMDGTPVDSDIRVLMVIHPRDISDAAQFALDQFVLRGGKLMVFVDPLCISDVQRQQPNPMGLNFGTSSSLPKLFQAWGFDFPAQVVADTQFMRELGGRDGRPQPVPGFLFVNASGIDQSSVVTAQVDDVWMPFPGALQGTAAAGLKAEPLLFSTKDSQLVDGITAQLNPEKVLQDFRPSGVVYNLAVRLGGRFKTAFPDGNPSGSDTNAPAGPADLKEASSDNVVYVFGDADMLANNFTVQINQMMRIAMPLNANLSLVQNVVEQAAGDASLVGARSRASVRRPFTVVREMESRARNAYQNKIAELDRKLQDLQGELSKIQVRQEGETARVILSPEQQQALKNYTAQQAETRKELRNTRRNLRQDVDSLENRLKWVNIAAMPVLVSVVGIALAVVRRRRMAAR
ncbi:MAG: Gldg family protein [Verrucomicrobiae bacterium]|nr:Gldg family protein [Verrucomicrobiae bacterium]